MHAGTFGKVMDARTLHGSEKTVSPSNGLIANAGTGPASGMLLAFRNADLFSCLPTGGRWIGRQIGEPRRAPSVD